MGRIQGRMLCVGLTVGSLALSGLAFSAAAAADTQTFLDQVYGSGVRVPGGDPELKEWGWEVCALLDRGVDPGQVRDQAIYNSQSTPQYGMSVEQADGIFNSAVTQLCNDKR